MIFLIYIYIYLNEKYLILKYFNHILNEEIKNILKCFSFFIESYNTKHNRKKIKIKRDELNQNYFISVLYSIK